MGATTFYTKAKGKTAADAFRDAVSKAQYKYGHGGYTGTIAEKRDFVMIELPKKADPFEHASMLIEICDERVDDKWGPAGCIQISKGEYLFFGWASE